MVDTINIVNGCAAKITPIKKVFSFLLAAASGNIGAQLLIPIAEKKMHKHIVINITFLFIVKM